MWTWLTSLQSGWISGLFTLGTGCLALYGVAYTMREHSRRERENREKEMRRQVYFELADAIAARLDYLFWSADVSIPDEKLAALTKDYGGKVARFHLVANLESLRSFSELDAKLQGANLTMYVERRKLVVVKGRQNAALQEMAHLEEMARLRNSGVSWAVTGAGGIEPAERWVELRNQANQAGVELQQMVISAILKASELYDGLVPFLSASALASRKSLGFEIDEVGYQETVARRAAEAKRHILEVIGTPILQPIQGIK